MKSTIAEKPATSARAPEIDIGIAAKDRLPDVQACRCTAAGVHNITNVH